MKGIAFNTWAYTSFPVWLPSYTLEETIARLSFMGYDGIEIGCSSPHAWPDYLSKERRTFLKRVLDQHRLKVAALLPAPGGGPGLNPCSPIREEREYTIKHYKDILRLAHDWESPTVLWIAGWVVHGTGQREAYEYSLNGLSECARYAEELGITLVVEPAPMNTNLIETADDALDMCLDSGQKNVKVMFDTCHALYRSDVCTDYVHRMKDKLHHIHLSDSDRFPPGQGTIDFDLLLRALQAVGYPGYLSVEVGMDNRKVDPDGYAQASISYLRRKLAEFDWRTEGNR